MKTWHLGGLQSEPITLSYVPRCWPFPSPGFPHVSRPRTFGHESSRVEFGLELLRNYFKLQNKFGFSYNCKTIKTMGQSIPQHDTAKHVEKNIQKKTKGFYGSDRSDRKNRKIQGFQHPNHLSFSSRQSDVADRNHDTWRSGSWLLRLEVEMSIGCQLDVNFIAFFNKKLDT